jgi:hypothetical protein
MRSRMENSGIYVVVTSLLDEVGVKSTAETGVGLEK